MIAHHATYCNRILDRQPTLRTQTGSRQNPVPIFRTSDAGHAPLGTATSDHLGARHRASSLCFQSFIPDCRGTALVPRPDPHGRFERGRSGLSPHLHGGPGGCIPKLKGRQRCNQRDGASVDHPVLLFKPAALLSPSPTPRLSAFDRLCVKSYSYYYY